MTDIRKFMNKNMHWVTLLLAALCAIATVGLVVYRNGGIFTYYGDYNCQQICFYMHAHELVKSGQIGWDWVTDLGVNFIGSYSFYLLFSPFFWLTLPFDTAVVPYLMAPLFVLKFCTAAFTAYFFVARFVKDKRFAVIGGLLYAFSGYCIYNLFFNHFLDVVAFFPLILIGLEMLITEDKHGPFALSVALNAVVNYWFFIGEVFFVILYFFIRITDKNISSKFRCFLYVALESVLGLCLAAVAVLPSVLAIIGNPRTGTDDLINGWNLWLYYSEQRVPAIIASFFFPPDMPSKQNMFTGQGAQWASMAGWLPLFGMTGAIAFVRSRKKSWLTKMIAACTVCALVPVLNSVFVLFNNSYYDRWFYMFELMLVLATVKALESSCGDGDGDEEIEYKKGLVPAFAVTIGLIAILVLTPVYDGSDGSWSFGLLYNNMWFLLSASFAVGSLCLTAALWYLNKKKYFKNLAVIMTAAVCAAYGFAYIQFGYGFAGDHQEIIDDAVGLYGEMSLPDEQNGDFVRADFYECFENMGLYWNIPSIRCFHSIVPSSIMEFYPEVGVKRDVSSKPEYSFYGLRALLSVKYLYADADETTPDTVLTEGFNYHSTVNGYNIYENENFIPMGFTYDYYITEEEYYSVPEGQRDKVLVSAIVLNNSQILRYSSSLRHLSDGPDMYMSYDTFTRHAADRAESSSISFKADSSGFTSTIFLSRKNLVFFSVPYDEGWTAYVNGVETAIERVNTGFMAVYADKGVNEIVFVYETPGLKIGAIISAGALVITAGYIAYFVIRYKRRKEDLLIDEYYQKQAAAAESGEPELSPEEDMTVIRRPEDVPPYEEYKGPEEKIYPEL
ncbi:MAG: YfhO family protein [Oscillospiraceae bacterium]